MHHRLLWCYTLCKYFQWYCDFACYRSREYEKGCRGTFLQLSALYIMLEYHKCSQLLSALICYNLLFQRSKLQGM